MNKTEWIWKESNGQRYLEVSASSPYELGVAIGHGLAKEIGFTYRMQMMAHGKVKALSQEISEAVDRLCGAYCGLIQGRDDEEIQGIAAGYAAETGEKISVNDLKAQSALIDIAGRFRDKANLYSEGCTNFAAVNRDGTVIHGQNYDSNPVTSPSNAWVFQKTSYEPSVFLLRVGAGIGWPVGINECGVAMTVSYINSKLDASPMTPRAVLVRRAFRSDTAEEACGLMTDDMGRSPFSYNNVFSDRSSVFAAQNIPTEHRAERIYGTVVQSNTYKHEDWIQYLKNPEYSVDRQKYAEQKLRELYDAGSVTESGLLDILGDKPVICRDSTILFMTREHFGMGNVRDAGIGKIPF